MRIFLVEVESSTFLKRLFSVKEKGLFIPLNSGIFIKTLKEELVFSVGPLNTYTVKSNIDFDLLSMKEVLNYVEGGVVISDQLKNEIREMLV